MQSKLANWSVDSSKLQRMQGTKSLSSLELTKKTVARDLFYLVYLGQLMISGLVSAFTSPTAGTQLYERFDLS